MPLRHRHIPVFHRGGENDLRLCLSEVLQFIDKMVKLLCDLENDLDQHGVLPGDAVAFDDIRYRADEGIEFLFLIWLQFEVDKCLDVVSEENGVDRGVIAADEAGVFHFLNPVRNSRRGEEDFFCNFPDRCAGIVLQHPENFHVNSVGLVFHIRFLSASI